MGIKIQPYLNLLIETIKRTHQIPLSYAQHSKSIGLNLGYVQATYGTGIFLTNLLWTFPSVRL